MLKVCSLLVDFGDFLLNFSGLIPQGLTSFVPKVMIQIGHYNTTVSVPAQESELDYLAYLKSAAWWKTKIAGPPLLLLMNPYPLTSLNHLTAPVVFSAPNAITKDECRFEKEKREDSRNGECCDELLSNRGRMSQQTRNRPNSNVCSGEQDLQNIPKDTHCDQCSINALIRICM